VLHSYGSYARPNYSSNAPKWASVLVFRLQLLIAIEERGGGRVIAVEQGGGNLLKLITINLAYFFAFAVKWVNKDIRVEGPFSLRLLLYDFYFTVTENNRLSAAAFTTKNEGNMILLT